MKKNIAPLSFIIYTPPYDPNSGGSIVLYRLCSLLGDLGHSSKIWLANKPLTGSNLIISFFSSIQYLLWVSIGKKRGKYSAPIEYAVRGDISNSIVVYPETVSGNPLRAKNVVRWFLNKPGRLTGEADFGQGELFFYQLSQFNDEAFNDDIRNQLRIVAPMTDIYFQRNFGKRSGVCHMIRKGDSFSKNLIPEGSKLIDGLSHHEIASHFNTCETFISFDLYTYYSTYAALCGCDSVVIPKSGLDIPEWRDECDRYGIAYGIDEIEYARETRETLKEQIKSEEDQSVASVYKFAEACAAHFV